MDFLNDLSKSEGNTSMAKPSECFLDSLSRIPFRNPTTNEFVFTMEVLYTNIYMKVPKLKLPKLSKKTTKCVIYFIIGLVIVLIGAFLYFKTSKIENMAAAGYIGNADLKRNDAVKNVGDIRGIIADVNSKKITDIQGNLAAKKEFNDIIDDKNSLLQINTACGKDGEVKNCTADSGKPAPDNSVMKYLTGSTYGTANINNQGSIAGNLIAKWYPQSVTSAAIAAVKKLN